MKGAVKWFSYEKGYGFIFVEGETEDLFFHLSEYRSGEVIHTGDKVSFEIGVGKNNKLAAKNVSFVSRVKSQPSINSYPAKKQGRPYHGKYTKLKDKGTLGRFFFGALLGWGVGFVLGSKIWIGLGYILGVIGAISVASLFASYDGSREITETCLKCGGTGKVTAINENYIGFQCEKCKSFWKKRNKDGITTDDIER